MATNIFKINGNDYDCDFTLVNSDDQKIEFTKSAFRGMTIEDDIFGPFTKATVSIANPFDKIEDDYFFRGDGRDVLTIKFSPTDGGDIKPVDYEFIVVGDEDHINPNTRSENIKTLSLIETNARPFLEQIPYGKQFSGLVGDIIKDIFKDLLGDEAVNENEWESGAFQMTYTPPVTWRYMDLLNYMLQHFYAVDGEIKSKAMLFYEPEHKRYIFGLISKIFENNKKLTKEAVGLTQLIAIDDASSENENNPPDGPTVQIFTGQLHNIGYSTPFYNISNNVMVSSLVHGYDPILGKHQIQKIDIKELRKKWKTKFVDPFKAIGGKVKPSLFFNNQTDKKFKIYNLPYQLKDNVGLVESDMINSLIFYNLQATFRNIGNTDRRSGNFIDIFTASKELTKSNEKIVGRWFVTSVKHIFFAESYSNEFSCCKTYVGPSNNVKEDVE